MKNSPNTENMPEVTKNEKITKEKVLVGAILFSVGAMIGAIINAASMQVVHATKFGIEDKVLVRKKPKTNGLCIDSTNEKIEDRKEKIVRLKDSIVNGGQKNFNFIDRIRKTTGYTNTLEASNYEKLYTEHYQNLTEEEREIFQKFHHLDVIFPKTETKEELLQYYDKSIRYGFGFFPEETIQEYVDVTFTGALAENVGGLANSRVQLLSIDNQKEDIKNYQADFSGVMIHEIAHLIFNHSENAYWTKRWKETIGNYDKKEWYHFAREYGMENMHEDMATVVDVIFRPAEFDDLLKEKLELIDLEVQDGRLPENILRKKITVMKQFLKEVSCGQMDEDYWKKIESGEIKDGIEAQKYFQSKK